MVNMPAAAEAVALAGDHPDLAVGVHLNLTCGRPLLPSKNLTDGQGRFLSLPRFLLRLIILPSVVEEVKREIDAQIQAAQGAIPSLTHIDSHHHLHVHPAIIDFVLEKAAGLGVPLRLPRESGFHAGGGLTNIKAALISFLAWRAWSRFEVSGVSTTDRFLGLRWMPPAPRQVWAALRSLPSGMAEMMSHPGYVDDDLRQRTSYTWPRTREMALLTSVDFKRTLGELDIRLISWRDLPSGEKG